MSSAEIHRLRRREAELLARIERMKQRMNERRSSTPWPSSPSSTRSPDELRRVQDKLAGRDPDELP